MILPIALAQKIALLLEGQELPSSQLQHAIVNKMLEDGIFHIRNLGKTKRMYSIRNAENAQNYIAIEFGINNLKEYIAGYSSDELSRSEAVHISSNSKLRSIRTFKGFLVHSYQPIVAQINSENFTIEPNEGTFTYIYDFDSFVVPDAVTIVGIENPENFRYIAKQKELFEDITPLFISRFPQNKDFIRWMSSNNNRYLHFGDFDFEGINIYLNEYQKHLGARAQFFIPRNIEQLIVNYGNSYLYDTQVYRQPSITSEENEYLQIVIDLIHKHKKGFEQEGLIG